ncbi:putative exocyst complex component sec8 [Eremomyces bilateralis CBS 781.70]|uniref:Exocyst complex component Sec8 n=1 Tax=Eremomyces bilateralis CBS 781.70 TaxID=1392243 RepID=A0A6G1G569_9PEZI|nr:putative exocyst complex component sec8 [Eremomyces bilateralis CBS 781.70]KAF1813168.1 putative exocyst complex component sec8 [Eremomyces bilateralis CBS 781.70]
MSRYGEPPKSRANGYNPYANGYGQESGGDRYEQADDEDRNPYATYNDNRARTQPTNDRGNHGGYEGYGDYDRPQEVQTQRPTSLERRQARRRSPAYDRQGNGARAPGGVGDGGSQIGDVLDYIRQDWDFMTDDKCIPMQVALQLMDTSSLGLASRHSHFRDTHGQLQSALRSIVNEHHQGFNSSIGTFHNIQSSIQDSQSRIRFLKEALVQGKTNLSSSKPELSALAVASQTYDDMLLLLATTEHLQGIPEKLEARVSEKRFLSAVELLQDGLRTIRKAEMDNIVGLSDLRVYLSNQEHSLTDILIEELHSHLYLKSPYCEARWKQYAPNQGRIPGTERNSASIDTRVRTLFQFLDKLDTSATMVEDPSRNPEADTFQYIQLLVEALNNMSRLDVAVETIEHRMPVELFRVVERCNNEVDQRHPGRLRTVRGRHSPAVDPESYRNRIVLTDLLWTLYARFEAIAEGHRVVHDVIVGITKREGVREASGLTRGFRELWKLYQSEIRSLLHDYLASDGNSSLRSGLSLGAGGNIFARKQRDKTRPLFHLTDVDVKSAEIASEKDELNAILKSSVPGLVSDAKLPSIGTQGITSGGGDGSATGHKLLVDPSVFNMGVLLPPSLTFLNKLKEVVPMGSDIVISTLTSFLDDFLVNVFLPQLDETLTEILGMILVEVDAFQKDSKWNQRASKPIFKGCSKFFAVLESFCGMLDRLPHDQAFTQLIISQLVTYYDKCYGWLKAMLTRSQPKTGSGQRGKAAAFLVEDDEIQGILSTMTLSQADELAALNDKETSILIDRFSNDPIDEFDIIQDRKNIGSLCLLYNSMKWLSTKMNQLRRISDRTTDTSRRDSTRGLQQRWTLVASEFVSDEDSPYLPLNRETADAFDGVVRSYQELATKVLRVLHIEIRCHIMLYLRKSLERTYQLEELIDEPDPEVTALNDDLVSYDEELGTLLQPSQHEYVKCGIGALMDQVLVHNAAKIPVMNDNGCGRMQLNILVLQQNLKNIEPNALLSRSAQLFDYFAAGPDEIIAQAKESSGKDMGFSYDELKPIIELYYSEALQSTRREMAVQARRGLDDHLLQLSEHMWQS